MILYSITQTGEICACGQLFAIRSLRAFVKNRNKNDRTGHNN